MLTDPGKDTRVVRVPDEQGGHAVVTLADVLARIFPRTVAAA